MDCKEFLLRTLDLASWKCHNSYNKNVVNNVKRDINRIFVEHEKLNLSPYHSAAVIISNLDSAMQYASFDNNYAGNLIGDAKRAFLSRASIFFTDNISLLFKGDLLGNTPLHIAIAYKNEVLSNSILKILNNEQLISLLTSRSGKDNVFTTPIERVLESKWNYFIKYLNMKLTDKDFSNLMEKLNSLEFHPKKSGLINEPVLSLAIKNLDKISTPDYIKFVTQMVENSNFSNFDQIKVIISGVNGNGTNLLHYTASDSKFNHITGLFLNKLQLPPQTLNLFFFAVDSDGRTPLHLASVNKNFDIAYDLISRTDNRILFLKDKFSRTAYDELCDCAHLTPIYEQSTDIENSLARILNLLSSIKCDDNVGFIAADEDTDFKNITCHHINPFLNSKKTVRSFTFQTLSNKILKICKQEDSSKISADTMGIKPISNLFS